MTREMESRLGERELAGAPAWTPPEKKRLTAIRLTQKTEADLDAMEAHLTAICGAKRETPKPMRKIELEQEEE